jgi:hypothetical protein
MDPFRRLACRELQLEPGIPQGRVLREHDLRQVQGEAVGLVVEHPVVVLLLLAANGAGISIVGVAALQIDAQTERLLQIVGVYSRRRRFGILGECWRSQCRHGAHYR